MTSSWREQDMWPLQAWMKSWREQHMATTVMKSWREQNMWPQQSWGPCTDNKIQKQTPHFSLFVSTFSSFSQSNVTHTQWCHPQTEWQPPHPHTECCHPYTECCHPHTECCHPHTECCHPHTEWCHPHTEWNSSFSPAVICCFSSFRFIIKDAIQRCSFQQYPQEPSGKLLFCYFNQIRRK